MAAQVSKDLSSGSGGATVPALLAMADYCLIQEPPQIKEVVQCLLAALSLSPPSRVEARIRLQLGLTLYHHTNNLLEARQTLEQAMLLTKSISGLEQIRFEAACLLARIHIEQGYAHNAKMVLKSALETSHRFPYWHCRLMLQKADIHVYEKDIDSLMSTLTQVADFADQVNAPRTRILCLLSKGAHLLIHKRYQEAANILSYSCSLVEEYTGPHLTQLKIFYMVIQVTHLLGTGLMKTARPHLKHLQQCIKILNSQDSSSEDHELSAESFEWFDNEQTYVLVYLVCTMHLILVGNTEKALSYTKKALSVIERRRGTHCHVMAVFEAHLLELIVTCMLMQSNCTKAGDKLQDVINICHGHSQMMYSHRAVLHTLLGTYAFLTDNDDRSIAQFKTALQHTNSLELKVFININLAIIYMKLGPTKHKELLAIMESLQADDVTSLSSKNLQAALIFLKGLNAFHEVKLHEAKRYLRETLAISNSNDLSKLSACSLLVLGQIFLSLGNTKESKDLVDPAYQLAVKSSDKRLQSWTVSILVDLHHTTGNKESKQESLVSLKGIQADLATDCLTSKQSSHHSLIQWTVGDWPVKLKQDTKNDIEIETNLEDNHVMSKNDHMTSQSDHMTSQSDHMTSQPNHMTSQSSHIISQVLPNVSSSMIPPIDHMTIRDPTMMSSNIIQVHSRDNHYVVPQQSQDHVTTPRTDNLSHLAPQTGQVSQTGHMAPPTSHITPQVGQMAGHMTPQSGHMTPQSGHMTLQASHLTSQTGHMASQDMTPQTGHMTSQVGHMTPQSGHVVPMTPPIDYVTKQIPHLQDHSSHVSPDVIYIATEKQTNSRRHDITSDSIRQGTDKLLSKAIPYDPLITKPTIDVSSFHIKKTPPSFHLSSLNGPNSQSAFTPPSSQPYPPFSSSHDQSIVIRQTPNHFPSPSPSTSLNVLPSIESVGAHYPTPPNRQRESPLVRESPSLYRDHQFVTSHGSPSLHLTAAHPAGIPLGHHHSPHHSPHQTLALHPHNQRLTSPQHGPYYHQHINPYNDPYHQYGYSALSPEAILRQRKQQGHTMQPQPFGTVVAMGRGVRSPHTMMGRIPNNYDSSMGGAPVPTGYHQQPYPGHVTMIQTDGHPEISSRPNPANLRH